MDCTVILQAEITDFDPRLYAGGGIRTTGNGVFALVISKYDNNAAILQITFARSVSKCLYSHWFPTGSQLGPDHSKSIVRHYRPVGSRSMGSDTESPLQSRRREVRRSQVSLFTTEATGDR